MCLVIPSHIGCVNNFFPHLKEAPIFGGIQEEFWGSNIKGGGTIIWGSPDLKREKESYTSAVLD